MVAAHLHPAGAQELWVARPAQNGSSQLSALPPTPSWRTADVDSYPAEPLGLAELQGRAASSQEAHDAAWASSAAAEGELGMSVPRSVTGPMIAAMQGSDDPRFEQSQLLDFLKQLDAGRPVHGMHGVCTACARRVHGLCTACAWHVHGMCTACARPGHGMCTACARPVHGTRCACA